MDKKIVQFNPVRQKASKESLTASNIGTIYIDLLISNDGIDLYFKPSFELEEGIDDELLNQLSNMLKKGFPKAVDEIFELYKSIK